jgi:hypothetical protein
MKIYFVPILPALAPLASYFALVLPFSFVKIGLNIKPISIISERVEIMSRYMKNDL